MDKKLCIIIPVHNEDIGPEEAISLKACFDCLFSFDTFLLFPKEMDVSNYYMIHPNLISKPVDKNWLSSIESYNKMKIDISFYRMFSEYEFMMTYELDSYVFNSNILKYRPFDFDFIGAPLFENYLHSDENSKLIEGCNSGFSIRKIISCINVLEKYKIFKPLHLVYKFTLAPFPKIRYHITSLINSKYHFLINGLFSVPFTNTHINEDLFWTQIVPKLFRNFKIADSTSAMKFSFEANANRLFLLNNSELPFGCHKWQSNLSFWDKYIRSN